MRFSTDHQSVLNDILRWRRDVRHFRPDAIAPDIQACMEASVDLAPSVGNSRPWRIVRVTSSTMRWAVADIFENCNAKACRHYDAEDKADYLALKLAGLREAPLHMAFFTETDPVAGRGLGRQTMPETLSYSTVMAIHTLWLTARTHNIGVGWVSILDPAAVAEVLEVPATWELTAYLCLGHPQAADDVPELHRAGWQADTPSVWIDR